MAEFFSGVLFLVFPAAMAAAAISDLATMTIPNRLSLCLAAAFPAAAVAIGMPAAAIGLHLLAGLIVLAMGILLFARGWVGGGDAKLAAAVSVWFGFAGILPFLAAASVFGAVLTIAVLGLRSQLLPAFAIRRAWVARLHDRSSGVPYGVALAAGALLLYPDTPFRLLAGG